MSLKTKKDFWVQTITNLLNYKGVDPADLAEGDDWENKLRAKTTWQEIETYALNICRDAYAKAAVNQNLFPADGLLAFLAEMGNNTVNAYWNNVWSAVYTYQDLASVLRDKIGVEPEDNTIAIDDAGNNILDTDGNPTPEWKHEINKKLPLKITDIPGNLDLSDLIYQSDLFGEVAYPTTGLLKDIIEVGLTGTNRINKYNVFWTYKINTTRIQEYKDAKTGLDTVNGHIRTILGLAPADPIPNLWNFLLVKQSDLITATTERDNYENQIKTACGLNATAAIPTGWENDVYTAGKYFIDDLGLNDPNNLPTIPTGENLASLLTKSAEYVRINTKLSGKVSDGELDTLLNSSPRCSHTDYDTIKTERDQLKTDKENHNCDCDNKVKAKESEIITKIITDLGLATERERENVLEAVITEIKTKISPPAGNSKELSEKQSKITELESQIRTLQNPKSLKDLSISSEIKSEMIEISQQLGLTKQSCAKLEKATSYQELSNLQKEAFQEKLTSEANDKNSAQRLNYGLGVLCIGSLIILAYMIIKTTSLPIAEEKKLKK